MIKENCVENFTSTPDTRMARVSRVSLKDYYTGHGTTGKRRHYEKYVHKHSVTCIRTCVCNFVSMTMKMKFVTRNR